MEAPFFPIIHPILPGGTLITNEISSSGASPFALMLSIYYSGKVTYKVEMLTGNQQKWWYTWSICY